MITSFKQTYIDALKHYFVGGMPEAVQRFAENKDFNEAREIQKHILAAYEQDFSKHAPYEIVPKIRMIWNSIPSQLAKENKKFIYGLVREGGRAEGIRDSDHVAHRLRIGAQGQPGQRRRNPSQSLRRPAGIQAVYRVDVGLLGCMTGLRQRTLLDGNDLFTELKVR